MGGLRKPSEERLSSSKRFIGRWRYSTLASDCWRRVDIARSSLYGVRLRDGPARRWAGAHHSVYSLARERLGGDASAPEPQRYRKLRNHRRVRQRAGGYASLNHRIPEGSENTEGSVASPCFSVRLHQAS